MLFHVCQAAMIPLRNLDDIKYFEVGFLKDKSNSYCTVVSDFHETQPHVDALENVVALRRPANHNPKTSEYWQLIGLSIYELQRKMDTMCSTIVDGRFGSSERLDVTVIPIIESGPPKNRIDVSFMDDGYTLNEKAKFEQDIVDGRFGSSERLDVTIIPIIESGPPKNRIDVVFMGDGYTLNEKAKFEQDMRRLTADMFQDVTFKSYLPLFNIWAIFTPSKESGIGVGGKPKNTAFGLYRDGTELRGIYPAKAQNAREVCKATGLFACDFPSLIGNDDFYGGLGGEFVIATRSETSGTIVLRHEMGHKYELFNPALFKLVKSIMAGKYIPDAIPHQALRKLNGSLGSLTQITWLSRWGQWLFKNIPGMIYRKDHIVFPLALLESTLDGCLEYRLPALTAPF